VLITGIGVLASGAIGNDAFANYVGSAAGDPASHNGPIEDGQLADLIHARRTRRMSAYVKLILAASTLAMRDAGVEEESGFAESCHAMLGSTHGASDYCFRYYSQIVAQGIDAANPMLFAEGVPNVGSAHLSMALGIKGSCQSIIGTRTAGLDALGLAAMRIASGQWDRAVVGAGEEYSEVVARAYGSCGVLPATAASNGPQLSSGATVFVLESADAAERRGARAYAQIEDWISTASLGADQIDTKILGDMAARLGPAEQALTTLCASRMDRIEQRVITAAVSESLVVSSLCDHLAEMFSATALSCLAGALLNGKLIAAGSIDDSNSSYNAATGDEDLDDHFILTTADWTGLVSAVRLSRR